MEKKNINNSLDPGERVTSAYSEIYHEDDYCDYKPRPELEVTLKKKDAKNGEISDDWVSPSDLLIGIIELKPPFTSKITRGKTHEGILAIGEGVLAKERAKFIKYLTNLVNDNELSWLYVLSHEKEMVIKKVRDVYQNIFMNKSKVMQKEVIEFYESTLQELEECIKKEVKDVLITSHVQMIKDLNKEIKVKLRKEINILEKKLQERYDSEVQKIKLYYELIFRNEVYRHDKFINQALCERNDAIKAFCRQAEAENATSTIYVMSAERKKCRIKQFLLENILSSDIKEKLRKIQERQDIIDFYIEKGVHIYDINKKWEERVNKILELFLKFISFSLKLLPEQTAFLLDLEKLVVLQLNEIQKARHSVPAPSILVEENDVVNIFQFEAPASSKDICDKEPFVIEGDLVESIPTPYGSRETLPSHVDLPFVRLQRQFIYAKCQKMEQVRAFLEARRCKCLDIPTRPSSQTSVLSSSTESIHPSAQETPPEIVSSNEPLLVDDINRLRSCPVRGCVDWANRLMFPNLNDYLDFTEEKFERVKVILGPSPQPIIPQELIHPKDIAYRDLPFAATKEPCHDVGTQYSSQEDISANYDAFDCPCTNDYDDLKKRSEPIFPFKKTPSADVINALTRRRLSLRRLMQDNPKLVEIFSDEGYDFRL